MFDEAKQLLCFLVKIELPAYTIRLCDGGFLDFSAERYTSSDATFGTIESVEPVEEVVGDEAPAGRMTFLPNSAAAAGDLSQPEFQGSRIRFWMVRVTEATGIVAESELVGDMELDTTELKVARGSLRLDMGFITVAERLFNINEGNVCSPTFHKSVWPGELGFDNATGVPRQVAWGVLGPPRGSVMAGGAGMGAPGPLLAASL